MGNMSLLRIWIWTTMILEGGKFSFLKETEIFISTKEADR